MKETHNFTLITDYSPITVSATGDAANEHGDGAGSRGVSDKEL